MTYDTGRFVWFSHFSSNVASSCEFYAGILPWDIKTVDISGVTHSLVHLRSTGQPIAGFISSQDEAPTAWISYLSVDDVDEACGRVKANGGRVLKDALDVPSVGRMQLVADPCGAAFFLFKGETSDLPIATGPGSVHWNELTTVKPKEIVGFYEKSFGYTHTEAQMPDGPYFMITNGDKMRGGITTAPLESIPSAWLPYVHVEDVEQTVASVKKFGGQVLFEPMDVPEVGCFAHIVDPQGGVLGIMRPAS